MRPRHHRIVAVLTVLLLIGGVSSSLFAAGSSAEESSYIVTLRREVDPDAVHRGLGLQPRFVYRYAFKGFAANMSGMAAEALRHDPRVMAVELDGKVASAQIVNPPPPQALSDGIVRLGIPNIRFVGIHGIDDHRLNVDVAIIDSGIQTDHPDLNAVQAVGMTCSGYNGYDHDGHGTHMSGIIGALDNSFGVVGIVPGARLWSVQVFDDCSQDWSNLLAGLDYVAQHSDKISVANASLDNADGTSAAPYVATQQAVQGLIALGVVLVAAAGNSGVDIIGQSTVWGSDNNILPAALPEVMAVSAMDPATNDIPGWSDYSRFPKSPSLVSSPGAGIDLAGPGVNIYSTYFGSQYATWDGTSMATAHITGLAALYIACNGRAHNSNDVIRIRQTLINTAEPQSAWGSTNTLDPDGNPEGLGMPNYSWIINASFSAVPTVGPAPLAVSFNNLSTDSTGYLWSFGDGQTSTDYQPTHTYTTPGTYTVTLVATNSAATNSVTLTNYITAVAATNLAPLIIAAPAARTLFAGSAQRYPTFAVAAASSLPLSYQWSSNGIPIGGATSPTLQLSNALPLDAAVYSVSVSNSAGLTNLSAPLQFTAPYGYAAAVTSDQPLAYWRLSEQSGPSAFDFWGTNDGFYLGSPCFVVPGPLVGDTNSSVTMDGASSLMQVPRPPALNTNGPFTAECWVQPLQISTNLSALLACYDPTWGGWALYQSNSAWLFRTTTWTGRGPQPTDLLTSNSIVPGTWYHVATSHDGTNASLYINGALEANTRAALWTPGNITPFEVGGMSASGRYLNANISEVALYAYSLAPARIQAHYLAGLTQPTVAAGFVASPLAGAPPLAVTFYNLSFGANAYRWDFGDGNTSTSANPTNVYTNAGRYTVSLAAFSPNSTNIVSLTNYIVVATPPTRPLLQSPAVVGSAFNFSFQTSQGILYNVQYKTTLNASGWTTLQTVSGDGSMQFFTNTLPSSPQGFYRVTCQPAP